MDHLDNFERDPDDPPVDAQANPPHTAEQAAPPLAPAPTVVNINLFGTVNRNAAELLREIIGTNAGVTPPPPLGAGPRYPGSPRLTAWEVMQGRNIMTPPALRGRGRPPGPQTIMNRLMAAAAGGAGAMAANTGHPSFLAATPPAAPGFARECAVCGGPAMGIIPCGHQMCNVCVDRVNGSCPSPMCTATFTRAQFIIMRGN